MISVDVVIYLFVFVVDRCQYSVLLLMIACYCLAFFVVVDCCCSWLLPFMVVRCWLRLGPFLFHCWLFVVVVVCC